MGAMMGVMMKDAGVGFGQRRAGWLGIGDGVLDVSAARALRRQMHAGSVLRESGSRVGLEFDSGGGGD
jgi:hypothetical protein